MTTISIYWISSAIPKTTWIFILTKNTVSEIDCLCTLQIFKNHSIDFQNILLLDHLYRFVPSPNLRSPMSSQRGKSLIEFIYIYTNFLNEIICFHYQLLSHFLSSVARNFLGRLYLLEHISRTILSSLLLARVVFFATKYLT